jgi:hypothetical protein
MAGIPTSNILQPGNISLTGGVTRQLVSDLQLLTPQYYKNYVEKYGSEDFTWWLSTYGGMEEVKNRDYFWFENRGKLITGVQSTNSPAATAGNPITLTLNNNFTYNGNTQSPLRIGETVRVASTNVEGEITAVTALGGPSYGFTFVVTPKISTQSLASAGGGGSFLSTDVLIFGGIMDAGEASSTNAPMIQLDEKYNNTITEMRETFSATDLAEMTEVYYTGGFSGDVPAGGAQAGTSLFTLKGLVKSNVRFKNDVEMKLMRGNIVNNSGLTTTTSVGSEGIIPKVLADGETVGYTPGNLDIAKIHEITRIMDVNGCASENMWLQDIYQNQNFSDGLFAAYPAGAWVWGANEKSEEAAINYGCKSISIDGYLFKVKKYRPFNSEYITGTTPVTDFFRNFGMICPQGETRDSKDASKLYKNITIMYQQPPKGGTIGNGIRVWQWGGASQNPTTGTMNDNVEMITYRGSRVVAANQFVIVQGS